MVSENAYLKDGFLFYW